MVKHFGLSLVARIRAITLFLVLGFVSLLRDAIVSALLQLEHPAIAHFVAALTGWRGLPYAFFGVAVILGLTFLWPRDLVSKGVAAPEPQTTGGSDDTESPFLRPRALAFGKKLRDYYETNLSDPGMPLQFFTQFYVDICWFKDRFATALGPENISFVETPIIPFATAHTVEWVVRSFNTEAARIKDDIPA